MLTSLKFLILLIALAESRILPGITSFEKELSFREKQIIVGKPFITENESFVYAVCVPLLKISDEKNCNVTIETPAFANATYKDTCAVSFKPDNPKLEYLSKLELYSFGDDKVIFSWNIRDRDYRPKTSRVRIINMSTCKSTDLPILSEEISYLVAYKNTFDVILANKTICKTTPSCRQIYDAKGKKISDSSPILQNYKPKSHQPLMIHSAEKTLFEGVAERSYFAVVDLENDKEKLDRVFKIAPDGKGTEMSSYPKGTGRVGFSDGYDFFSVCTVSGNTKVNCRQYDSRVNIKMNANLEFKDESLPGEYVRFAQPHNLQGGGILLLTGSVDAAVGPDAAHRFDEFTVMKLHQDGTRERSLVIDGLNFQCTKIQTLRIAVSENHLDEYCFHFACKLRKFDQQYVTNDLKFTTKCMPTVYLTMAKRRPSIISY